MKSLIIILIVFLFAGCLTSNALNDEHKKAIAAQHTATDTIEIEVEINGDTVYIVTDEDGIVVSDTIILTQILTELKTVIVHDTIPLRIDTVFVDVPVHDTIIEIQFDTVVVRDTINMEEFIVWAHGQETGYAFCDDGLDNDGDGLIDCEDKDCGMTLHCYVPEN